MKQNKNKILIVEDDASITKFLQSCLSSNDYDVITASTGQSALGIISSHCPDLILLDLGLPDMDGNRIIQSVRTWSRVPVIVISARSSETDKAEALDLGCR